MAEAKHTPGPWTIDKVDFGLPVSHGVILHCPPYGGGGYVRVADCSLEATNNNPQWLANARLIAAAPDMLAICKRMLNHPLIRLTGDVEPKLIAAIAKAEGRS